VVELDPPIGLAEMPRDELLAAEKEALGLYVSSHPLQDCRQQLARAVSCGLAALADRADNETVTVGGIIGAVKNITTRRGEPMMFIRLDDLQGAVEVVVVPAVMAECREHLVADGMVLITGRVDQKGEGETKLVAQIVKPFTPEEGAEEERLVVRIPMARLAATELGEFRRLLVDHAGSAPVVVDVETGAGRRRLRLGEEFRVDPRANSLVAELKTLFGERCLA
jgi:DNA polymerase-3 subunit alpha